MTNAAYQKLSRIDIAVALDTVTSRFCVIYNELTEFVAAAKEWKEEESVELDNVLHAGPSNHDYHNVGENLKHQLALFTTDVIMGDRSYIKQAKASGLDVRACLLGSMSLWEMSTLLEGALNNYPMVLRNMRAKSYKGIDTLESMYHSLHKDTAVFVEERLRHLNFSIKALSVYAPAHASLHRTMMKNLAIVSRLKPALIELTQTHNQFVEASHPALVGAGAAYA